MSLINNSMCISEKRVMCDTRGWCFPDLWDFCPASIAHSLARGRVMELLLEREQVQDENTAELRRKRISKED